MTVGNGWDKELYGASAKNEQENSFEYISRTFIS